MSTPATPAEGGQLFLRNSTGLVREASAFDAMIFNAVFSAPVGATLAWGVFFALSAFPGADLVTATLISFVLNIPVIIMMLLVPLQFFTGVLLWDVTRFSSMVETFGGVRVVDTVHVLLFILFCGFIIVHVYLASLGHTPSAHFKAMITGYEEVEDEP